MTNYAIIDDTGNVLNLVVVDPQDILNKNWSPPDDCLAIETDIASVGWTYKNGQFAPPVISSPS